MKKKSPSLSLQDPIFQTIIDSLPLVLFWTDINHVLLGGNKQYSKLFGFSSLDQWIGLTLQEFGEKATIDIDLFNKFYEVHDQIIQTKQGQVIEYNGLDPVNKELVYLSHKEPLLDENGDVVGVIDISTNITELKKTQSQLIKAKASADHIYQNIIDALPVLLFWSDKDHVIRGNNLLHAQHYRASTSEEMVGMSLLDMKKLAHLDDNLVDKWHQEHNEIMATRKGQVIEYPSLVSPDSTEIKPFLCHKEPLIDENGDVIGVTGISMDISDLKKAQRQAEVASQAKSDFIANMSHDLRTPMYGISGMQDVTLMAIDDAKAISKNEHISLEEMRATFSKFIDDVEQYETIAQDSTQQLIALFNQILEAVRLESGKIDAESLSFDLIDLVERNISLFQSVAAHKQIELNCSINSRVPRYFDGLANYLHRVLCNLLSNALKFTEQGNVKVSIDLENEAIREKTDYCKGDRLNLIITIEDTGIGIPRDKFEVIFGQFSRLTDSSQGIYKGSGLGLYVVKKYIEAMGGTIAVSSTLNKGSCFTLVIPLTVSEHGQKIVSETLTSTIDLTTTYTKNTNIIKTPDKNKKDIKTRVLVVEDGAPAAMVVQVTLNHYDCLVDIAKNGREALEKVNQFSYDLIFMDIGLPDVSGTEVTKEIRAIPNYEKSQIPIVALTGHAGDPHQRQRCFESGINDVLNKPASATALQSAVEYWVNLQRFELS